MMLSCTACTARYIVAPAALGTTGRTAKCVRCGHSWFQESPPPELVVKSPGPDVESAVADHTNEPRPSRNYPPPAHASRRQHPATAAGWMALAAMIIILAVGLWAGRTQLVAAWPPAERLYKSVGMGFATAPPGEGLEIRGLAPRVVTENGARFLVIEGDLVNITDQHRPVPNILISLLNETNEIVEQWPVGLQARELAPGESATFNTRRSYPKSVAERIEVLFGAYILSLTDRFAGCRGPVLVAMRSPKSGFSGHGPLCYVRTD